MPDVNDKPEPTQDELALAGYEHLVSLCEQGMLYEAENWLRSGHSAAKPCYASR